MSPLISAPDLLALIESSQPGTDLLILDCRFNLAAPEAGQQAYHQGHLPGAGYAHLDRDLSGPKTGLNGRHPLPEPDAFASTLQAWGLTPDTRVVAYDDAGGMFAARAWWMLRWMGHARVQVLDGGWKAWQHQAQAAPITTDISPRPPGSVSHLQAQPACLLSTNDVLALLDQPEAMQLIDARAPDRFAGDNETMDPVGGHIPGALNRFFQLNLDSSGCLKPAEQLRQEFCALLGDHPLDTVVHQCGSGVTACHNLLAMEVAGLSGTRLYGGSWSAWCANPAHPMARKAHPTP
jgi:thiosulfate/3-mercaptopyruvate sulfurtransferase